MKQIESAGVVVYRIVKGKPEFLLLLNAKGHWDFGKGTIEPGEDKRTAAKRELLEEAGISATLKDNFQYSYSYFLTDYDGQKAHKTVYFFIGTADSSDIILSHEHTDFGWFSLKDALLKLTFDQGKELLKKAKMFLLDN